MPKHDAAIVGVSHVELSEGRVPSGSTELGLQAQAARHALADAGIEMQQVDAILTTGAWGVPGPGQMPATVVAEYLGIRPRLQDTTCVGGASFESHVSHAAAAIAQGDCEVALITYASMQRTNRARSMGGRQGDFDLQYEVPYGLLNPVGAYALAATRYMHEYHVPNEHLAAVAVAARKWAQLTPDATRQDPLSIDDVMQSRLLSDPLRALDCCLVTDGAGAVVLTSAANAATLGGATAVNLLGWGEASTHNVISQMPDLTSSPAALSGPTALGTAGIGLDEVDIFQLYDSFTITVLLTIEALGLCDRGGAGELVASGATAPGGELPMNTNGGGLSYCHPGMYGIFLLIEAVHQLRGDAGERQVPGARIALVNGTGGTLSTTSTCVLGTG